MNNKKIYAVVGCQFGSEAKGALSGYLAGKHSPDTVVANWSPNTGHTFVDGNLRLVHSMIPLSVVSKGMKNILIGPGSVVDLEKLLSEIDGVENLLDANDIKIIVHPNAAVVSQAHRDEECFLIHIGSTMKGVSASVVEKMSRRKGTMLAGEILKGIHDRVYTNLEMFNNALQESCVLAVEGCQGYSLSLHHGFYPYCTSRDTATLQLFSDCGIPMSFLQSFPVEIIGCVRTFPIRVSNRFDATGKQVGYSGPCYSDQKELSWEEVGVKPEYTSVSKQKRRVFTLSEKQIKESVWRNGVTSIALTFCDYLCKEDAYNCVLRIEDVTKVPVNYMTYGPDVSQIIERHTNNEKAN